MADVKISGLPASSVPLAGTEVLPIVQGGQTRQVSVNNLTTGKAVSATQYTSTIVTGTAPLVVASTTEVANLRAANATSADTANQVKSNATTGVLQVTGPAAAAIRIMTTPDANFTVARTDAAQTFTGAQTFSTPVAVGSGGSGTSTAFTAGSVVFAGVSGVYSQKNANFFWDNTNNRLGVGTTAPVSPLTIQRSGGGQGLANGLSFKDQGGVNIGAIGSEGLATNDMQIITGYGLRFYTGSDLTTPTNERMRVFSTGGVSIGDTTDPGAGNLRLATGNLVIGTSGKGIDFSATTGTGTSELLADYEEGTWTATLTGSTAAPTTPITATCPYIKVGNQVTVTYYFGGVNTTGATGDLRVTGLPFTVVGGGATTSAAHGTAGINGFGADAVFGTAQSGTTRIDIRAIATTVGTPMVAGAGKFLMGTVTYFV
jgi:hypothetical protein